MTNAQTAESYMGKNALDPDGNKIGSIGQVYVDDQTGQPDWITVNTGLFGAKESFAPLSGSTLTEDGVMLPFDKDVVKGSPEIKDAAHLDEDEQDALYSYYQQYIGGASAQNTTTTADATGTGTETAGTQYDTDGATGAKHQRVGTDSSATGDNADGYLTRSEEQLHVGTQRVEAGRAKLRKFVVTEQHRPSPSR